MTTKTLEKKFDVLTYMRLRDKDKIIAVSHKIDNLREKLAKKILHSDSVKTIREWRNSR